MKVVDVEPARKDYEKAVELAPLSSTYRDLVESTKQD